MSNEKMISTIILTNGHEERLKSSIDSIINQDYPNKELIIVSTKSSEMLDEYEINPMIKIHIKPELSGSKVRNFALNQVEGEYVFFIDPQDTLLNDQSLSQLYKDMEDNNSNFLSTAFITLRDGIFYFGEPQEDVNLITTDDYWFYFVKIREIRPIYRKLFGKELLNNLSVDIKSDQQFVKYLILNAKNPIFDKKESGKYVWFDTGKRQSLDLDRNAIPMPKYLSDLSIEKNDIDECINIAICIDDNYCQHINPMVYSIEKNTREKVRIHIVYYKLKAKSLENIIKLNELLTNVELKLCKVREYQYDWLSKFKENNLPTEAYFRLLLPELLPDVKRILYLDVDMLVLDNLGELYRTDLGNNILGVVRDFPFTNDKNSWSYFLLGEFGNRYFNSGMLLMDLVAMRGNNIVSRFMEFILKTSQHYLLGDQDAFNIFFFYNVKILEDKYNYIAENQKILQKTNLKVVVMHYCGYSNPKPWLIYNDGSEYVQPTIRLYREYQRKINKLISNNPKVLLVVQENRYNLNQVIESIDYQNYGNYEVAFIPLKENSNAEILKKDYPQITIIKSRNDLERMVGSADYLYYMKNTSYFSEWDAISRLVDSAIEKAADYIIASHQVFSMKYGNYQVQHESNKLIDISDRALEDLIIEKPVIFTQNEGFLVRKEILRKSNSSISRDMPDATMHSRIFNNAERKYLYDRLLWIKVDFEN
ncbi:glycosyltransferase family 8 protein [Ligilactobacillus salivarius]|uniref:Glycosyl transferase family 8 n=1 Tax=Ligilactobacillus salivarius TaxID=1624 RepID=A0A2U2M322_9LACO|nr:glycosyltransferase [Ligilactobacillus salivarius]PWG51254.1 glycosyl transferase family 8 [Ligilactobacillus salivarius]